MAEHSSVTGDTVSPRLMVNCGGARADPAAGAFQRLPTPSTFEKFGNLRCIWNGHLFGINTAASGQVQAETVQSKEIGQILGNFRAVACRWTRLFHEGSMG